MFVGIFSAVQMANNKTDSYDPRPAATRLAAVQAIYELDMMDVPVDEVLADFTAERWQAADDETTDEMARPKPEMLRDLVIGVAQHRAEIDAALIPAMTKGRTFDEIEAVVRAILRAGVYELINRKNVPARVLLSTYAGLGDAFFDDNSPQSKLIAGILNAVARNVRAEEFSTGTVEAS